RMERKERSRLGSCKTPLGCSISQFFTFARKYSSQSWEPYGQQSVIGSFYKTKGTPIESVPEI
ncbi:hypothetical protein, partial [Turicimonas muris]|uniref:hypothetical protein n=1 Tax=Turicimonas muris TaxID=1796652 RepID=UPI0026E0654F